ncbi:hypothetical protein, partial [Citrobacter sp. C411]|uniref:hypothetical protein n=1 Tax=Citrobacter sp. C411 TaxID=3048144 RepID=UPI0039C08090
MLSSSGAEKSTPSDHRHHKGYQGPLSDSIRFASAGMMKSLNTNMTGLNLCYAIQILETF